MLPPQTQLSSTSPPRGSQQLPLRLRGRSSGEAWRSVFTCSRPVQLRQVKRAQRACQRERTKKRDGLLGQQGLWTVSSESCMPAIFLACCCRPSPLSRLPRLLLNAVPWLSGSRCHPSHQEPCPSCPWLQSLLREHWALLWTPEEHAGHFFPSRSNAHSILQQTCPLTGQKPRSLREYSAHKPAHLNKKHLRLPNFISPLNKASPLYSALPRSMVDTYRV